MKSSTEVDEARRLAVVMTDRLDEEEYYADSIAPALVAEVLAWVLEHDGSEPILEQLRDDVEQTEDGIENLDRLEEKVLDEMANNE